MEKVVGDGFLEKGKLSGISMLGYIVANLCLDFCRWKGEGKSGGSGGIYSIGIECE